MFHPSISNDTATHLITYPEWLERKRLVEERLQVVSILQKDNKIKKSKSTNFVDDRKGRVIPYTPRTDVHWDFVMKEMMWLGADFCSERKRQISLGKKLAASVQKYHETKEKRRLRTLQQAEQQRRRLSAKIGREVKGWWTKIEKIVAYKQKRNSDEERQRAMNKQLVALVKQTEKYSESLSSDRNSIHRISTEEEESDDGEDNEMLHSTGISIEEALALSSKRRNTKSRIIDYSRMKLDDKEFYGESTADEQSLTEGGGDLTGSENDGDLYSPPPSDGEDGEYSDETTLLIAMEEEMVSRDSGQRRHHRQDKQIMIDNYSADPQELRKLREEQEMDIDQVLLRLQKEGEIAVVDGNNRSGDKTAVKRVQFASDTDPGEDADDDGDASDVEDYRDVLMKIGGDNKNVSQADEDMVDYEAGEPETDDETTLIQEENLPTEITAEQEIDLLKKNAQMPIEELRKLYSDLAAKEERDETSEEEKEASISNDDDDDDDDGHESSSEEDDDGEFRVPSVPEVDDLSTFEAEEKLGRDMSYEEELEILNRENDMSVEELKAMYAGMDNACDSHVESDAKIDVRKRDREKAESEISLPKTSKRARKDVHSESEDGAAALDALEASAERARQTLASRPFLLAPWVKLREYQQIGLNWLVSLQSRRLNGILADEMGLGKTLQTISLLAYLASYKGIWGPHLVIVPTSVIINWETELKRFCPSFKVLCYYGSAKRRKELRTGWTKTNWYHVVITSYQLAVQDAFAFKRKKWYYLILDEAQNIKNFQSQRWQTLINFNTQRRLLLTGTPLQNSLMELWSLLHFLMPYIFKSRKEFSYWFSNPMNNIIEGTANCNNNIIKRLHGIIRPFVLRRLKKDVETQMPDKFEHIVKCQLSRRQMTLYEEFLSRSSTRQALKKGGNFMGMMNVLMQLRKVCNHPDLFEPRSIITPFILPSISISVPRCMCEIKIEHDFVNSISKNTLQPLWCGSSGLPSIDAALRHNQVEASELRSLCGEYKPRELLEISNEEEYPTELQRLVQEIHKARQAERFSRTKFLNIINRRRCRASAFPYSAQILNILEFECNIFGRHKPVEIRKKKIVDTPAKLLELRKSESDRARDMNQTIEKYVFRVPPAGGRVPKFDSGIPRMQGESGFSKYVESMLLEPLEEILEPYNKARARLTSFFPDKKLVQYDAGKLQTLAKLLRKLKEGGHRALIFTQMSKLLDVLEAFLSMNGHTYLRLDGTTEVGRRQRYMDRFNNDTKIFCFILSTRSGGMGINLTGADTVIFYDSDWNPAMDAQAQDRAHRIGQTRDVHIYRLITEHSIEENILIKAQKKKNLDVLVMDRGKFDANGSHRQKDIPKAADDIKEVYTKKGLQAILGVSEDEENSSEQEHLTDLSKEQMEIAMASLEDEDDVKALRGAQKEAAEDLKEFDESNVIAKGSEEDVEEAKIAPNGETAQMPEKEKKKENLDAKPDGGESKSHERELEKEFAAWQNTEGFDAKAIEKSMCGMEKYGLKFREDIDPFYSVFYINEQRRKIEVMEEGEEIDIEEVERKKAMEEEEAIENQDLLATGIHPEDLVRQRSLYRREKARLRSEKKRRKITGEFWSQKIDGLTKKPFWYNEETGEATWNTPLVVADLWAEEVAKQEGWSRLPMKILVHIMGYLLPFPERQMCGAVCQHWKIASTDIRFVRHVYPVEMRALASRDKSKWHYNHFATISEALDTALPGDTIELADGHYWVNDPGILIDKPIRFVGDENNPTNVVIEISGSLQWSAKGGWVEGITFRRPKMTSGGKFVSLPILDVMESGKIDIICSVFDNDGSTGPVANISGSGNKGKWHDAVFRNGGSAGIKIDGEVQVELNGCTIKGSRSDGLRAANKANFSITKCTVEMNTGYGIHLTTQGCQAKLFRSFFKGNTKGVIRKESHCNVTSSGNVALVPFKPEKQIPGFKLTVQNSQR